MKLFSNTLAIRTGRGKAAPTIRGLRLSTGKQLDLLPGGRPQSRDVEVTRSTVDGREHVCIKIPAHRKEAIGKILGGILAKTGRSLADLHNTEARRETQFIDERVTVPCELGGKDCFRAAGKMVLNLLAAKIGNAAVRVREFEAIRAFIGDESTHDEELVNHDYKNQFPNSSGVQVKAGWCHSIAVSANSETGIVAGFVELYGGIRFSALLADSWHDEAVTIAYIVDPVTGLDEEVSDFTPSSVTREQLLEHSLDKEEILKALDRLSSLAWKRMQDLYNERIVEESFAEVLSDVPEGGEITDDHVDRLSRLVATRFVSTRSRQSSAHPIDPAEILGAAPKPK